MATAREKLSSGRYDAVVVGSGPNGLTAAILMLVKGYSVAVVEGQSTAGGGCRSAELTLPGFVHDICSAVHPLGFGSPIFRTFHLEKHGLEWIQPDAPYAHPFDGGKAVVVHRSVDETAEQLGKDGANYRRAMGGLVPPDWNEVCNAVLSPLKMLKYPFALSRFGLSALKPARFFAQSSFRDDLARGTFAGVAAHSALKMEDVASASFGIVLGLAAHAVGWPIPRGGTQNLANALVSYIVSLGGELITDTPVTKLTDLPDHKFLFLDITPKQILQIAGDSLPPFYRKQLANYKYGPATFKLDWALDGPIPWSAPGCKRAGTIHIGATLDEISRSESGNWQGIHSDKPYVLLAQPSLFDPSRAPEGKHTGWAYCHVPNSSTRDMTEQIENQVERFAPGFKKLIAARSITNPRSMEQKNQNYVGGDINGGAFIMSQMFTRPVLRPVPYSTPIPGMYICSASTPPGGGVHGMGGYYAVQCALNGWK